MANTHNTSGTHEFKGEPEMLQEHRFQPHFMAVSRDEKAFIDTVRSHPDRTTLILSGGEAEQLANAGNWGTSLETRLANASFVKKFNTEALPT